MIDKYAAEHYAKRLKAALDVIHDINYELKWVLGRYDDDICAMVDEEEPHITLYRLQEAAKED